MSSLDFKKEQISFIIEFFNSSGIYSLNDTNDQILYVGKSIDLSKRVLTHLVYSLIEDSFYSDVSTIKLFKTKDEVIASHLEVMLIEHYNPIKNRICFSYSDWVKTIPFMVKNINQRDLIDCFKSFNKKKDLYSIDLCYFRGDL